MTATNYLEDEINDHVLAVGAYAAPAGVFVALHIGDPGEDGTANPAAETTRQAATFGASSGGSATTTADIDWTSVSTTETYSHFVIHDAVTGGNPLLYGALTASVAVTAGDNFTIATGNLTVTVD